LQGPEARNLTRRRKLAAEIGARYMANYIWLFIVAGGAAILGSTLAFGMINQNGKRSAVAIAGAFIVSGLAPSWASMYHPPQPLPKWHPTRKHQKPVVPHDSPIRTLFPAWRSLTVEEISP
jgi:hypothetical protein